MLLCGGAGGKTDPLALRAGDLSAVNDALLSKLRNKLRKGARLCARVRSQRQGAQAGAEDGCACAVVRPARHPARRLDPSDRRRGRGGPAIAPQGLSCAGYGSVVTVTAAMGMAAANEALRLALSAPASACVLSRRYARTKSTPSRHGVVANPRDTYGYHCGLRLALTSMDEFRHADVPTGSTAKATNTKPSSIRTG